MRLSARRSEVVPALYEIDGNTLKLISVHRDLSVLFNSRLRLHNHTREVLQRIGGLATELLCSVRHSSMIMLY